MAKRKNETKTAIEGESDAGLERFRWPEMRTRVLRIASREWPLILLIFAALIIEVGVYRDSSPNVFPDSGGYKALAEQLLSGHPNIDLFTFRTPGYPAFVALIYKLTGSRSWQPVIAAQFMCGILIPLLIYMMMFVATGCRGIAALAGAGFLLDRFSLGMQLVPLTEFIGGFLAIASIAAYIASVRRKRYWTAPLVGLLFFLCLIVRPSFQLLFPAVAIGGLVIEMIYRERRAQWRHALLWYAIICIVAQIGIWSWSYVIYRQTGVFGLSHQLGASLTNHTGTMMERAPEKYAKLRDIYVRERNREKGNHINLFDKYSWKFTDETSQPLWKVSLEFKDIDKYLITHYPGQYFKQVRFAWNRLWGDDSAYLVDITDPAGSGTGKFERTAFYRYVRNDSPLSGIYGMLDQSLWGRPARLRAIPWLLLILTAAFIYLRRRDWLAVITAVMITGTIMYHMLLHAMVQMTEFGRYKMPVQALWFCYMIGVIAFLIMLATQYVRRKYFPAEQEPAPRPARKRPPRNKR